MEHRLEAEFLNIIKAEVSRGISLLCGRGTVQEQLLLRRVNSQSDVALCAIPKLAGSLPPNTGLEGRSELNGSKSFP